MYTESAKRNPGFHPVLQGSTQGLEPQIERHLLAVTNLPAVVKELQTQEQEELQEPR